MKKTLIAILLLCGVLAVAQIGSNPRYIEELVVGGGTGETVDGGADFEKNGDITTTGTLDVTGVATFDDDAIVGGDVHVTGQLAASTAVLADAAITGGATTQWSTNNFSANFYIAGTRNPAYGGEDVNGNNEWAMGINTSGVLQFLSMPALGDAGTSPSAIFKIDRATGDAIVSGTFFVPASIEHVGDSDTKIQYTTDGIRLEAGGNRGITIGASNVTISPLAEDVNFIVHDASGVEAFRVDAGTGDTTIANDFFVSGDVGIGTTNPGSVLHITNTSNAVVFPKLTIGNEFTGLWDIDDIISEISFRSEDTSGAGPQEKAKIQIINDFPTPGSVIPSGAMTFWTSAFNAAATEKMRIDSAGNVGLGGTTTPDAKLQVVGDTKLGDDNTNYASFAADGELTLTGTARVTKHVIIPVSNAVGGGSAPTQAIINNFAVLQFSQSVTKTAYVLFHIPPDWAVGTDLFLHVHWAPINGNAGDVVWDIDYKLVASEANEVVSGSGTNLSVTDSTQGLQDELLESADMTIAGADMSTEDILGMKISRDTSDGNDTYGSAASLVLLEIEYISDRLGEGT